MNASNRCADPDFVLPDPLTHTKLIAEPRVPCLYALLGVEDRGETLFCQVGYFGSPEGLKKVVVDGKMGDHFTGFALVSIKNALLQPIGYHVDTLGLRTGAAPIALTDVPTGCAQPRGAGKVRYAPLEFAIRRRHAQDRNTSPPLPALDRNAGRFAPGSALERIS